MGPQPARTIPRHEEQRKPRHSSLREKAWAASESGSSIQRSRAATSTVGANVIALPSAAMPAKALTLAGAREIEHAIDVRRICQQQHVERRGRDGTALINHQEPEQSPCRREQRTQARSPMAIPAAVARSRTSALMRYPMAIKTAPSRIDDAIIRAKAARLSHRCACRWWRAPAPQCRSR